MKIETKEINGEFQIIKTLTLKETEILLSDMSDILEWEKNATENKLRRQLDIVITSAFNSGDNSVILSEEDRVILSAKLPFGRKIGELTKDEKNLVLSKIKIKSAKERNYKNNE